MSFKGMNGDFESQIIDDFLWMMAPGKGTIRFAQIDASKPQGGTASTLLALTDFAGHHYHRAQWQVVLRSSLSSRAARVGPVDFESIGFEEKFQRIDADVVKTLQVAMVETTAKTASRPWQAKKTAASCSACWRTTPSAWRLRCPRIP